MGDLIDDIGERSLRYLAEIFATGGVRMAAETLGVNPSVISRQVAALERWRRFLLIERRGRHIVVTEIGQVLIDHYRDGQRRQRDLAARLEEYQHLRRKRVALGVGEGFIGNLIARALQRFSMMYPDILVEIRSGPTPVVASLVRDDAVDIGLCARSADDPAMAHPSVRGAAAVRSGRADASLRVDVQSHAGRAGARAADLHDRSVRRAALRAIPARRCSADRNPGVSRGLVQHGADAGGGAGRRVHVVDYGAARD